ncbi:MAG TPA: hypothetical protein VNG89_18900 [Vicinamibacterales bacterium]|nr:hypothetical protein [Vicinamibacterales bacterium]
MSYGIGWAIGVPVLVPVLNTLVSFPLMVAALRRGDVKLAVARMLLWALTMGIAATLLSWAYPAQTEELFLRSGDYRREMFTWVMTGRGAESTPSQFIPQQIGHAALFTALALASGGALAMPMGAALMNYMGHYVGTLAGVSRHPIAIMVLGWHPWAVIRVVSFVALGVVLSAPLLARVFRFQIDRPTARRIAIWAAAGLVADIILKTLLAPAWQRLLIRTLG